MQIKPCRVDTFTINTPDVSMYVYNYLGTPKIARKFTYQTTQQVSCGYQAKVKFLDVVPSSGLAFTTYSSTNQVIKFDLLPTERSQSGTYTYTISYELIDYPIAFYNYYLLS